MDIVVLIVISPFDFGSRPVDWRMASRDPSRGSPLLSQKTSGFKQHEVSCKKRKEDEKERVSDKLRLQSR